ncbi:MAG: Flp pilus assembly protein CpaB [Planctomycetes bacterium]|nr:Flp pilus assembly protein CpaB [Planctomycetota bacterium]
MQNKLALVVAVLLGLVSLAGVHKYVKDKENEFRGDVNEVAILVAKADLERSTELTEDMVTVKMVPERYVPMEALRDSDRDRKVYIGQILHDNVKKDAYLMTLYFNPGETRESLETRVSDGMRAITIRVDDTSGFSGMLRPGMYVDLIGTFEVELKYILGTQVTEQESLTKTFTLLKRKPVLAVGKELGNPTGVDTTGPVEETEYTTVTLQVTPQEAQEIVYAQNKGRINLVLRRKNDVQDPKEPLVPVDMEYLLKKAGMK